MTDDERNAMEWLDARVAAETMVRYAPATTIKRLLARPVLPEDHSGLVAVMLRAWRKAEGYNDVGRMQDALTALYAHLAAPCTKEVWRVQPEGWPFEDFTAIDSATYRAGHWLAQDIEVSIRKTTVPA